ncbi:DUF1330 domain-containing protein [Stakelama tenebrarum]|uniref:DUF1330 domain-containing protein n=1 Tax=Stakelama tenebrarum TaxID=2711215 RepID=A0A6G6Y1Z3_9SPHN|nr:DUF1330 domain-containing protein [Sphingosinithalassobacter tenebrarum]QIG78964.1 DUF1330 domain-containing protein [Sphingosinithalassobacter tenebrarum]
MQYVDPDRGQLEAFRALPIDDPIEMLNLIRYRDLAEYPDDHACASAGLFGAEAYRRYMIASAPIFARHGGEIVWKGEPQLVVIGPDAEAWDMAFVARYPDARAFLAMLADPEYREAAAHRRAGVQTSRLIRMFPGET